MEAVMYIQKSQSGFTLIELMIAVAVVAIIVAIAIPNYNNYLTKSRRSDAKAALMEIAQLQETYFADNNRYAEGSGDEAFNKLRAKNYGFQVIDGAFHSKEGYYRLEFSQSAPNFFEARATPVGMQQAAEEKTKQCYAFLLDSRGQKRVEGTSNNVQNNQHCWN
jgi:type IV pilus assembly protein PilE